MADRPSDDAERLTALRAKIDAIDESMHGLLMQRAAVIDELIAVKGAAATEGAAFRPGREAAMMERLSARHSGSIPFVMIGHIWREIISTFTWLQARYEVHVATADIADGALVRDLARYQFGFTVPLHAHETARDALDAAKSGKNAVALVAANAPGDWWMSLGNETGLMVMARLPLSGGGFEAPDCLVIAPPLSDPAPFDVRLYTGRLADIGAIGEGDKCELLRSAPGDAGAHVLLAVGEGGRTPTELLDIRAAGGYFAPDLARAGP